MRTNIVLDDQLVAEAMRLTRTKTKREVVDLALRELVAGHKRLDLRELFGSDLIAPDYDYKQARAGRSFEEDSTDAKE
ncbi:MAG TPA: type II toxin-antitoxin system VapB family antitoxin [Xanthomonadaceae bacterium]|nr:type II toxin-antitoxin system VapB family antitoxin [Xanthomonadaceae bacterium]